MLRSALWRTPAAHLPGDVAAVMEIAHTQRTRPLILDALQRAGWEDEAALDQIYKTASTHITLNRSIATLTQLLRGYGIDPILLKGQGVAVNYPEPMLRECGDIDFYVGTELYEKASALVRAQESVRELKSLTEKHSILQFKGAVVEIHKESATTDLKRLNAKYLRLESEGLGLEAVPVEIGGVAVNTPADSFNAFYLFYHFLLHAIYGGLGIRQICDWILFLHSRAGRLDTSFAQRALETMGLRHAWQLYASVAVDFLGLPAAEMPFYVSGLEGTSARVLSLIFEDGNFGHAIDLTKGRPAGLLSGKLFSMKKILDRFRTLYALFPEVRPLIARVGAQYLFGGLGRISKDSVKQ